MNNEEWSESVVALIMAQSGKVEALQVVADALFLTIGSIPSLAERLESNLVALSTVYKSESEFEGNSLIAFDATIDSCLKALSR